MTKRAPARLDTGLIIPLALAGILVVAAFVHQDLVLSFQEPVAAGDAKGTFVFYEEVPGLAGVGSEKFLFRHRPSDESDWTAPVRGRGHVLDAEVFPERVFVLFDTFYSVYDRRTLERTWSFDYQKLALEVRCVGRTLDGTPILFGTDAAGRVRAAGVDDRSAGRLPGAVFEIAKELVVTRIDAAPTGATSLLVAIQTAAPKRTLTRRERTIKEEIFGQRSPSSVGSSRGAHGSTTSPAAEVEDALILVPFADGAFGEPIPYDRLPESWALASEPARSSEAGPAVGAAAGAGAATVPPPTRSVLLVGWPARLREAPIEADDDASGAAEDGEIEVDQKIALYRLDERGAVRGEAARVDVEADGLLGSIVGDADPGAIEAIAAGERLLLFSQSGRLLRVRSGTPSGDGTYAFDEPTDVASMSTASYTLIWTWFIVLIALVGIVALRLSGVLGGDDEDGDGGMGGEAVVTDEAAAAAAAAPPGEPAAEAPAAPSEGVTEAPTDRSAGDAGAGADASARVAAPTQATDATGAEDPGRPELATAFERALAFSLDFLLCSGVIFLILPAASDERLARLAWEDIPEDRVLTILISALVLGIYGAIFEGLFGQTLGKKLMGIEVRGADGSTVSPRSAILRNLFRLGLLVHLLYLVDLVAMAITARTQRPGDLIADTVVSRVADSVEVPASPGPETGAPGGATDDGPA